MTRAWTILAFLAVAGAVPASGHHAFGSFYLEAQTFSVEGTLEQFDYVNPHAWIHIAAADKDGHTQRVGAEWSNPNRLKQAGIEKDTLKPGDRLILTGSPARNPADYTMHLKRIERPADGWTWVGQGQRF